MGWNEQKVGVDEERMEWIPPVLTTRAPVVLIKLVTKVAYETSFGNSDVFMRLTVCGYQYVFLSQECWMENSSITPCRRSPQRKKPSFPQMLERVTWPITLHSWFLSESRPYRLFFHFPEKHFEKTFCQGIRPQSTFAWCCFVSVALRWDMSLITASLCDLT